MDGSYEFTQFETNVINKIEEQDDDEFWVFVIKTILDKGGKGNRKI